MIMTIPWRRIILHFSQIFLTEGFTFTVIPPFGPYLNLYVIRPRDRS